MFESNQDNFDWGITNTDVVLYIPNFGRKKFLEPTLKAIKTDLPLDKWMILVVNDGVHEDLSDLEHFNLRYFTFDRGENPSERNGCMIRNFVLKRLQSRIVATRDPEIFMDGNDYLQKIYNLDDQVFRPGCMVELAEPETPKILSGNYGELSGLAYRTRHKVTPENHRAFHAGFAVRTQTLVDMGGYDEGFKDYYGYEDVDLLIRLQRSNASIIVDNSITAYHIWHMRKNKFLKTVRKSGTIFEQRQRQAKIIANEGIEWGQGL